MLRPARSSNFPRDGCAVTGKSALPRRQLGEHSCVPVESASLDASFAAAVRSADFQSANRSHGGQYAEWKSAIQRVGNLRYEPSAQDCTGELVIYPG